jgi:hypothetical protein
MYGILKLIHGVSSLKSPPDKIFFYFDGLLLMQVATKVVNLVNVLDMTFWTFSIIWQLCVSKRNERFIETDTK